MEIAQWIVDKWQWLISLGTVGIVAILFDIGFNSARRSLIRFSFQRLKAGKDRYDRWKDWLQADYHPGLAEIKKYFVDRPYARDLPREKVRRLSKNTAIVDGSGIEDWPQDWPETTGQTLAANFINKRGRWLRGNYQRTGNSHPEVHLIVGNGGMGKSALLSYLFVRVAQNWRNFLPLIANRPIYLHHLRNELLPWEAGGSLHNIPDHGFSGAVLLFDELGMYQRSKATDPAAVIRAAMARYPQARCFVFAGRATNLLPHWQGIEKLQAADDVRLVCHHLLPFRPEEEAHQFIKRRFSRWGSQREQAQQLVAANPVFERPLFLSYLPLCLGEVFAFYRETWDRFDWSKTKGERPTSAFGDVLVDHFRQGFYGKAAWEDQKKALEPRLNDEERKWLTRQSPFLFDGIFQVAGPGPQINRTQSPFSKAGNLLQLVVDQWLYREISRPGTDTSDLNRAADLHAFCRRWAIEQFRNHPDQLLEPFPWSLGGALPKRGFGSVLSRIWDPDPANNFYRFAHRSIAEYFLAEAILREEITLEEARQAEQEQVVQMAFDLYANSPKGRAMTQAIRAETGLPLPDVKEYGFPFSAFEPFALTLLPNLRHFRLVEGKRTLVDLPLNPNTSAWKQVLEALGRTTKLNLSNLELEDDDLEALVFFKSLSELNLSKNSLVSPPLHNYFRQLTNINLSINPLGEEAGAMLLENSKTDRIQILVLFNDFPARQVLELLAQPGIHDLRPANYINFNSIPLAYLIVRESGAAAVPWLSAHPKVLNAKNFMGRTALMIACEYGEEELVKYLIEANANLGQQNVNGATALTIACEFAGLKVVKRLINAKANLEQQTKNGGTALMFACEHAETEIVKYLIDANANIEQQTANGWTPLLFACQSNTSETVRLLIDAKANLEQQTKSGTTAIMLACQYNDAETVKHLIDAKANIEQQNIHGWTAMMLACQYNDAEIVKHLIDAKAKLEHQSVSGVTALMVACQYNDAATIQALIEAGVNVNQRTFQLGQTTLIAAASKETANFTDQHVNLLKLLNTGQCNLNYADTQGATALSMAEHTQRHQNARALKAALNGTFNYDQLLAEWEQYKEAMGISIPSSEERIRLHREASKKANGALSAKKVEKK